MDLLMMGRDELKSNKLFPDQGAIEKISIAIHLLEIGYHLDSDVLALISMFDVESAWDIPANKLPFYD
jgi:hypothetical protein